VLLQAALVTSNSPGDEANKAAQDGHKEHIFRAKMDLVAEQGPVEVRQEGMTAQRMLELVSSVTNEI
jgi:hypothetical protein